MDVTTKALALKATDYKENDKLILLYSLEYGKITVHAKGIRKADAKLKFCADQFCFGQYELAQVGDRFTLKTCQQLESFYNLREDIIVYYCSSVVAECLANCTDEGESEPQLFVETLKALEQLSNGVEPLTVTLRYLLQFVRHEGFALDFCHCHSCNKPASKMFLSFSHGGLLCQDCNDGDSVGVSARVVATCKMVDDLPYDKLHSLVLPGSTVKDCLDVLNRYVGHCFCPLKSLTELLKLA